MQRVESVRLKILRSEPRPTGPTSYTVSKSIARDSPAIQAERVRACYMRLQSQWYSPQRVWQSISGREFGRIDWMMLTVLHKKHLSGSSINISHSSLLSPRPHRLAYRKETRYTLSDSAHSSRFIW